MKVSVLGYNYLCNIVWCIRIGLAHSWEYVSMSSNHPEICVIIYINFASPNAAFGRTDSLSFVWWGAGGIMRSAVSRGLTIGVFSFSADDINPLLLSKSRRGEGKKKWEGGALALSKSKVSKMGVGKKK